MSTKYGKEVIRAAIGRDAIKAGYPEDWMEMAKDCIKKADYQCQHCGAKKVTLTAAHVKGYTKSDPRPELLCLCRKCHRIYDGSPLRRPNLIATMTAYLNEEFGPIMAVLYRECNFYQERIAHIMAVARMLPTNLLFQSAYRKLTDSAKAQLVGLMLYADDEGRGEADAETIASILRSWDAEVGRNLKAISEAGFIQVYEVNGISYYQVSNWKKMQVIRYPHPSDYPAPPEEALSSTTVTEDHSATKEPSEKAPLQNQENQENQENQIPPPPEVGEDEKIAGIDKIASELGCPQEIIKDLVHEFTDISLLGEYEAAKLWYQAHKTPIDLSKFRRWLTNSKENPAGKRAGKEPKPTKPAKPKDTEAASYVEMIRARGKQ